MNKLFAFEKFYSYYWVKNLLIPFVVFLFFFLVRRPVTELIFRPVKKLGEKTGSKWPGELVTAFSRPLSVLLAATGVFLALEISPAIYQSQTFRDIAVKCFRSLLICLVAWGLYHMAGNRNFFSVSLAKRLDFEEVLYPFFSKVLRFAIIALALLIVAQEWNYSISGLLAGLGLGGLAFALAAQEMLSNLFGGMVVFIDKPFKIGDWIQSGDMEGVVEDISFRSIKIRTFTQAVVTIPNSKLISGPVTNFSRMGKRRVSFIVGLEYDTTSAQLRTCTEKIRRRLLSDSDVDPDSVVVVLDSFGESSLNLMAYFFTLTTDWKEYLFVREKVYYSILEILEDENASLAFPTQTVYMRSQASADKQDLTD